MGNRGTKFRQVPGADHAVLKCHRRCWVLFWMRSEILQDCELEIPGCHVENKTSNRRVEAERAVGKLLQYSRKEVMVRRVIEIKRARSSDSQYILKIEMRGLLRDLDEGCEEKQRDKNNTKFLEPSLIPLRRFL